MLKRTVSSLMPTTLRRRIIALSMLLVLVLTLSMVACTSPTPAPTPETTPPPILLSPTTLQITELAIDPAEVNPGERVLITANLTNTSDTEGSYTVRLFINNIAEVVREVTMPAGGTRALSFSGSMEIPGTYSVTLGERTEQFVVRESSETLILSSPAPETAAIAILSSPDPETAAPDQNTSSSCCGGGSSGSSQGGCSGCGSSSSSQSSGRSSSQGGCGCSG